MARTPDIRNIRERSVWRNGKLDVVYQVRIRLQDDRGILRTHTQTFDAIADAIRWRDAKRAQVHLGEMGDKLEKRRLLRGTTLADALQKYLSSPRFLKKQSASNEAVSIKAFLNREAEGICKKPLADVGPDDFRKYVAHRLDVDQVKAGTLRRELNPIRHMFKIACKEWGLPVDSPFNEVELPAEEHHRERILRTDERCRLYRAIDEGCRGRRQKRLWIALTRTALTTGIRRGEALQLE